MKTTMTSLVIGLSLIVLTRLAFGDGKKLVVVVAKGSLITRISRADLKSCFMGQTVAAGGRTLVPFNARVGTPERAGFDLAILGMSTEQVGRFWVDRKIRGQSNAPRSLPSAVHIATVAAKFPGAIAYLPVEQLTADVQAVAIDDIPYTDARYDIVER